MKPRHWLWWGLIPVLLMPWASAADAPRALMVSGQADPRLRLGFAVRYLATGGGWRCRSFNPLAGASTADTALLEYPVTILDRRYAIRLPLAAKPADGPCRWRPREISIAVVRAEGSTTAAVDSYRSLIGIDRDGVAASDRIVIRCRPHPTAGRHGTPAWALSCDSGDGLRTLQPGQAVLVVDLTLDLSR